MTIATKKKWHSWAWGKAFTKRAAQGIVKDLKKLGRTVRIDKVKTGYKVRYQ